MVAIFFLPLLLIFLLAFTSFKYFSRTRCYLHISHMWIVISLSFMYNRYITAGVTTLFLYLLCSLSRDIKSKRHKCIKCVLFVALIAAFLINLLILFSILAQSLNFFSKVPISEFLFGLKWNHNMVTLDKEKIGYFGIVPLLVGTLLITIVAMLISIPLSLFSAVYISEYAGKKIRHVVSITLQVLSAVPTVVYGYFAIVFLSSFIKQVVNVFGLNMHSESAIIAGVSIGIMILPFTISLLEDAICSVPQSLRYGSVALGATQSETIWNIVIPYAMPTILSAILLSISRVIGETMIVLMAVGINANLTFNPLHSITTMTVQIATLLTGDQDFDDIQTLAAYALSLILFIITWSLNAFALFIMKRN